ncbi:MAG: DUF2231 domain-containing protein [Gordonia amarae]|jgi:uncharacterized membrane protein
MDVINGVPAHVLLVHFVVVLAPLTAIFAILCVLWPAARQRLVWPTLVLAAITCALTPLTTEAGEWLYNRQPKPSTLLQEHAARGDTMIYVAVGLLLVATFIAYVHVFEGRGFAAGRTLRIIVAVATVVVGLATMVQVYRIGDAGARATWGTEASG